MKKYQIIYADPPYRQRKGGLRKARPHQGRLLAYPTIGLEGIKDILARFDGNVLFLWTIDKFLHEAEQIGIELGYKLHARMIWDKTNGIAPAFTVRFSHEYLLWLYKSPFLPIAKEQQGKWTTVLREVATRHSIKPQIAYEFIEAIYPNADKVELFARNRRDGWDCWGNEIESDIEL